MRRKNQGITLIALIITVIVLIILAGVTINMVVGDNGIISKSKYAKEETRGARVEEERDLWKANQELDEYGNPNSESLTEIIDRLVSQGLLNENEKDQILGNEEKEIEATGKVTIGSRTIVFGTGKMTLVDMFKKAEAEGCMNLDGACPKEDHLHIGDYVNYQNPTSGTYTITAEKSGLKSAGEDYDQVYDVSKNQLNWRVLGINKETGGLKLIAGSPMKLNDIPEGTDKKDPYLYLYGAEAYVYGPEEMDKACEMYKNEYANKARSVNMEDINQVLKIEDEDDIKANNAGKGLIQYGEKYGPYDYETTGRNHYTPESWLNGKTATTVEGTVDGYAFIIGKMEGVPTVQMENTRAKSMLFDNIEIGNNGKTTGRAYWLASCGAYASPGDDYASFGPGVVLEIGSMTYAEIGNGVFSSHGYENGYRLAVRPVVSLKSEITKSEISRIADKGEDNWNYNAGQ